MKNLEQKLLTIMVKEEGTIRSMVAQEALNRGSNIKIFFKEFIKFGGASGMIKSLFEYSDLKLFFDQHYFEISNILLEFTYENFYFKGNDLKIALIWIAFERVARDMATNDLGLDI